MRVQRVRGIYTALALEKLSADTSEMEVTLISRDNSLRCRVGSGGMRLGAHGCRLRLVPTLVRYSSLRALPLCRSGFRWAAPVGADVIGTGEQQTPCRLNRQATRRDGMVTVCVIITERFSTAFYMRPGWCWYTVETPLPDG